MPTPIASIHWATTTVSASMGSLVMDSNVMISMNVMPSLIHAKIMLPVSTLKVLLNATAFLVSSKV